MGASDISLQHCQKKKINKDGFWKQSRVGWKWLEVGRWHGTGSRLLGGMNRELWVSSSLGLIETHARRGERSNSKILLICGLCSAQLQNLGPRKDPSCGKGQHKGPTWDMSVVAPR